MERKGEGSERTGVRGMTLDLSRVPSPSGAPPPRSFPPYPPCPPLRHWRAAGEGRARAGAEGGRPRPGTARRARTGRGRRGHVHHGLQPLSALLGKRIGAGGAHAEVSRCPD